MEAAKRRKRRPRRKVLTYDLPSGDQLAFDHADRARERITLLIPGGVRVRRVKKLDDAPPAG